MVPQLVRKIYKGRRFHQRESLPKGGGSGGGMPPAPEPADSSDNRLYAASGENWVDLYAVYEHVQATPAMTWDIQHDLGKLYPTLSVFDGAGRSIECQPGWDTATDDFLRLHFGLPTAGRAVLSR